MKISELINGLKRRVDPHVLALACLGILSHRPWFKPGAILVDGDWRYWPNSAIETLHYSWGTWLHHGGAGYPNAQLFFGGFKSVWSLVVNAGGDFSSATQLTFFMPIAIMLLVAPYFLACHLTGDRTASFYAALFYGSTSYGLVVAPPIQFVYALAPFVVLTFLRALDASSLRRWLVFSLVFSLGVIYEVRIMYVVALALLVLALFRLRDLWRSRLLLLLTASAAIGIGAFWLWPSSTPGISSSISGLINRGLFGDFLFDMPHAITISTWIWTGGPVGTDFTLHPVAWWLWFAPLVAFSALMLKNGKKTMIHAFAFLAIVGVFLSKQSAPPFAPIYRWLFENMPGFGLFREATKMYTLTSLGYLGLIAYSLAGWRSGRRHRVFLACALMVVFCAGLNLRPAFTNELSGMYRPAVKPEIFRHLDDLFESRLDSGRVLWVPNGSMWSPASVANPKVGLRSALDLNGLPVSNGADGNDLASVLMARDFWSVVNASTLAYVVVLDDASLVDGQFLDYDAGKVNDVLGQQESLVRFEGDIPGATIYKNQGAKPHIYLSDANDVLKAGVVEAVDYSAISPTQYEVRLKGVSGVKHLHFAEAYHKSWKLRVGEFSWLRSMFDLNYFLPHSDHYRDRAALNSFVLDIESICQRRDACVLREDGKYDLVITIFFEPQSRYQAGLAISGGSLLVILAYLVVSARSKKSVSSSAV